MAKRSKISFGLFCNNDSLGGTSLSVALPSGGIKHPNKII